MVGMVGMERNSLPKLRHSAELNSMMVRPSHEHRGIGRRLVEDCIAQARLATGLELITLCVSTSNQAVASSSNSLLMPSPIFSTMRFCTLRSRSSLSSSSSMR